MRIVVISPESGGPARGPRDGGPSSRPGWSATTCASPPGRSPELEAWLARPAGGLAAAPRPPRAPLRSPRGSGSAAATTATDGAPPPRAGADSRSCHDLPSLRGHLRAVRPVLFGPVFPSLTKPGYGPAAGFPMGRAQGHPHGRGTAPGSGRARPGDRRSHAGAARALPRARLRRRRGPRRRLERAPTRCGAFADIRDAAASWGARAMPLDPRGRFPGDVPHPGRDRDRARRAGRRGCAPPGRAGSSSG